MIESQQSRTIGNENKSSKSPHFSCYWPFQLSSSQTLLKFEFTLKPAPCRKSSRLKKEVLLFFTAGNHLCLTAALLRRSQRVRTITAGNNWQVTPAAHVSGQTWNFCTSGLLLIIEANAIKFIFVLYHKGLHMQEKCIAKGNDRLR